MYKPTAFSLNNRSKIKFVYQVFLALMLIASSCLPASPQTSKPALAASAPVAPLTVAGDFGKTALIFEPNVGQSDARVHFQARGASGALYFMSNEVLLNVPLWHNEAGGAMQSEDASDSSIATLQLHFVDANPEPVISGADPLPGYANYMEGNDARAWHTNVPTYAGIRYVDLFPDVNLEYQGKVGALKGTYVVAAGADPAAIQWRYSGARTVQVDEPSGDLVMVMDVPGRTSSALELRELAPVAWQMIDGQRIPVVAHFAIAVDGAIGFQLGTYDPSVELIIDPTLVYSTFLGGSLEEAALGIAVDDHNNAYLTGYTLSNEFPVVNSKDLLQGERDAFVAKINAAGTAFDYVTYLGGEKEDIGNSISVDPLGNAYIAGSTKSADFPVLGGLQSGLNTPNGAGFVTKLSPDGNILYSTFLGGEGSAKANGIAVDIDGYAYVVGQAGVGYPLLNPFGTGDAFITKLDVSGSKLVYSTFIGITNGQGASAVAVDWEGNAYVTGSTFSKDFLTKNPYQSICTPGVAGPCSGDGWVAKIDRFGTGAIYSTFLGGNDVEYPNSIAVDAEGNAFVSGFTSSSNFPTTAGTFQPNYGGGSSDYFVTKLNPQGNGLVYSTFLGGNGAEGYTVTGSKSAIALDSEGNALFSGITGSPNFPTVEAIKPDNRTGDTDGVVVKLNPNGGAIYSTYLGSATAADGAYAIATNAMGNAFVAGGTRSTDFPTLNPIQQNNAGGFSDIFVTKISHGAPPPVTFEPRNLTFDTLQVHATSDLRMIIVRNTSNADITISNVSIAGMQAQDFTVQATPCTQSPVNPGATCAVGVSFSPRASGMRYARILFSSPSWTGQRGVPVRGKGAPTTRFDPQSITFPTTKPNTASEPIAVTLTNIGLEPLELGAVTIKGLHGNEFQFVEDSCSQRAIPAEGTCIVSVRFTPAQYGDRFGVITFASQVFDEPTQVPLQGTGGATPALTVEGLDWGICIGSQLTVKGTNFPKPGSGLQGAYEVYFDGAKVASGTTDANGNFTTIIGVPQTYNLGDSHVISATDVQVANAKATAPFNVRTMRNDLPVILIPGVSGSMLDSVGPLAYTAPPDPDLAGPIPDTRQLLPQEFFLLPDSHAWIDGLTVAQILTGNYRVLDTLQLMPDGQTPKGDMLGIVPELKVGDVLWNVNLGVIETDFYGKLRDFLLAQKTPNGDQKYVPNENLFYLTYDWRKDLTPTAAALDALIDQALAKTGKDKVVIVAHSLGGVVSRNYLLRRGGAKVDQLITLGTPYLGSVLVPQVLENGSDWGIGGHINGTDFGWGMHPKQMRKLAQNFGAAYQMMPSKGYFDADPNEPSYDPHYIRRSSLIDGVVHHEHLDYTESVAFIGARHNAALNETGEQFREQGIGDLRLLTDQVFHQRIVGAEVPAIGRLNYSVRRICGTVPFFNTLACIDLPEFSLIAMDVLGDDTVPLHSALGANRPDDHRFYILPDAHHGALTSDPRSLGLIDEMLRARRCSNVFPPLPSDVIGIAGENMATAAEPEMLVTGAEVDVIGAADLDIYDAQGRHTGIVPDTAYQTEIDIPRSNYGWVDGGRTATLMADGDYTVVMRGIQPNGAAMVKVSTLANGATTKAVVFESVAITGTGSATFTLSLPGPTVSQVMNYQYSSELPVQPVSQLPVLTGEAAGDLTPPVTAIAVDGQGMVALTAVDGGGSGLRRIQYSTENPPLHYADYTAPFQLGAGGTVTAFATDWAGNSEYPPLQYGDFDQPSGALYMPAIEVPQK